MRELTCVFTKPLVPGTRLSGLDRAYALLVRDFVDRHLLRKYFGGFRFVFEGYLARVSYPSTEFYREFYQPSKARIEANHGDFGRMVNYLAGKPINIFVISGPEGIVGHLKGIHGKTNGELAMGTLRGWLKSQGIISCQDSNYAHVSSDQQVDGVSENIRDLRVLRRYGYIPRTMEEWQGFCFHTEDLDALKLVLQ